MLTLFTTPKPFRGVFATLQSNALRSWRRLPEVADILVFGDEPGAAEAAADLGLRHVPHVSRNELGMPLVRDLFKQAEAIATTPYLAYANADIVFMDDLLASLRRAIAFTDRFLLIGERYNIEQIPSLHFEDGWDQRLRAEVIRQGFRLYTGIDYFVYPRSLWMDIPDTLVVGRGRWDNWPLYEARLLRAPVIDATPTIMAVHAIHDYSHHPDGAEGVYGGPEARRNFETLGGRHHLLTPLDATHLMTDAGVHVRCRSCYPMCVCKPASF
jgi:hypothetical protein